MSHQTSRMLLIAPAAIKVLMNCSNSAQSRIGGGSPAVGSDSNTLMRLEARPVSSRSQ
jgi:hypothetical protein